MLLTRAELREAVEVAGVTNTLSALLSSLPVHADAAPWQQLVRHRVAEALYLSAMNEPYAGDDPSDAVDPEIPTRQGIP